MVSASKLRKHKHGNMWPGAIKNKGSHCKKFLYFTSAQRKKNNELEDGEKD